MTAAQASRSHSRGARGKWLREYAEDVRFAPEPVDADDAGREDPALAFSGNESPAP